MEQALAGFLACLEGSGLSVRTVRLTEMRSSWRFLVTALDYAVVPLLLFIFLARSESGHKPTTPAADGSERSLS